MKASLQYPYYYAWGNNPKRIKMCLRPCKIIAHGKMNSRLIEFKNGQQEIVSGNSLRKIKKS
uniref:Uncharacterized protein n=1 Tax=viral metagenome TaxID=1070528 RepID=A0A6M3JU62_9ZZZZ